MCDRDGRKIWVIALRATFLILGRGRLGRAKEQAPISHAPAFAGEPASSAFLFDSDFPLSKTATDVVLIAQAFAPGGRPVEHVEVGFQCGPLRKVLRVHGERVWMRELGKRALVPSRAKPFLSMPMSYERAFGGSDSSGNGSFLLNPLGRGYAEEEVRLLHTSMPNVEDPHQPITDSAHRPRAVAGFGAIAPHWPQRTRFAGTYDARWARERAPLWPEDFDARFFQVAPEDQQVSGFLRGGEACFLYRLTQDGELGFALPKLRILVTAVFRDREERREAQLHTVVIEPDLRRLSMVWHSSFECHDREHLLQCSIVRYEGERTWVETRPSMSTD